jgi:hypothetical protein
MKKKFLYSSRKAKGLNFDKLEEMEAMSIKIANTFTRKDVGAGSMVKPGKGKYFDPKEEDTRIFVTFDIQDRDERWGSEIGNLNAIESWHDVIDVAPDGNSFEFKGDVTLTVTGDTIVFALA